MLMFISANWINYIGENKVTDNLVFLSKEKVKVGRFQDRTRFDVEVDDSLKENYISFLENIYDEVLRARVHSKKL